MAYKILQYITVFGILSFIAGCGGDGDNQPKRITIFLRDGCNFDETIRLYTINESTSEVELRGTFSTTSPEDLSCESPDGLNIELTENTEGEFDLLNMVYLTSDLRWFEETIDPNLVDCTVISNCFSFSFPIAQTTGSADEFILTEKPNIDELDLELEISESTINCFGIGVGTYTGNLSDIALFELKESSDLKYRLSDEDLDKLKDFYRQDASPISYITLYDIYKSSITTPQFTAILKLKTSDQESCLNSQSCLLFKKDEIGNGHPLQSSRLYYWEN